MFSAVFLGAVPWKLPLTIPQSSVSHLNAASFDPIWMHGELSRDTAHHPPRLCFPTHKRQDCRDSLGTVLIETTATVSFSADGDNYLNDGHFPPERPLTDCRRAVHSTQITRATVSCHNCRIWHLAVVLSFMKQPAGRSPTLLIATMIGGMGGRPWRLAQTDFNVIARCLLLFYQIDIGGLPTPIRRCCSMLWCCRFRCPMCTSAELYWTLVN